MTFGPCAAHNPAPPYNREPRRKGEACETCKRIAIEGKVARRTIGAFLANGYALGVNDGEETTIEHSRDAKAIEAAMFTTDEDYLLVYEPHETGKQIGWVRFIYGNGGWDVINDYTTNLEPEMKGVCDYAETFG